MLMRRYGWILSVLFGIGTSLLNGTGAEAAAPDVVRQAVLEAGLNAQKSEPHPWFDATFALSALHLNRNVDEANRVLKRITELWPIDANSKKEPETYWALSALSRTVLAHGALGSGRLSDDTEAALKAFFWPYTSLRSRPDTSNTWILEASENHDLMRKSVHCLIATVYAADATYRDRSFSDGKVASDHRDRWAVYFRRYCEERARKGLFVEVASPTYQKYDMQCLVNLRDFAPDSLTQKQVEKLMHLLWADWAQDQVAGYRGGGKSRVYSGGYARNGAQDGMFQTAHLYFDMPGSAGNGPTTVLIATSDYAPPAIVEKIAHARPTQRYTSLSRRPGVGHLRPDSLGYGNVNVVDPENSLLRVTRVAPDYVLGTVMFNPKVAHTGVSAQNRWSGVVFPTGADRRVYLECGSTREDKPQTYDALITAQLGPVLVAHKKRSAHKYNLTPYVVVPSAMSVRRMQDGWLFLKEGSGYVGIYAMGGYRWEEDRMVLLDQWRPILMACGSLAENGTFEDFVARLLETVVTEETDRITFQCLGAHLSVSRLQDALPTTHGKSFDLQPSFTYQSPYINAPWNSSVVHVTCGKDELILDFRARSAEELKTPSQDKPSDFDNDGAVGFHDFLLFAGGYGKSRSDVGYDACHGL
ncbi:MAG: hypothetical protein HOE48_20015 [Candidatus Latescibacteria bacterium]|nr:hypothetical protein [Candidatus Latescibacterota bacterium]